MTYSFIEDQTNISVSLSAVELSTLSNFPSIPNNPNELFASGPFNENFLIVQPTVPSGIIKNNILDPLDAGAAIGGFNPDGTKVAIALAIGLGLAFLVFSIAPIPPLAVLAFCTPIAITALAGWHNPIWALTVVIGAPLIWFGTTKMAETSVST